MYKLIIVDDEDIERESMAAVVPWHKYNIEVIATAWNGIEGCERIQSMKPDIVITDIKMPVMNGIEMIRKVKEFTENLVFVVLSGYGEYEYTSQAMELGVRHYILKPSKEEKIIETVQKAIDELEGLREQWHAQQNFRQQKRRLEPRAREQMFRNVLLGKEQTDGEYLDCLSEVGRADSDAFLLVVQFERYLDYLEQFALTNIFSEVVGGEQILLTTAIGEQVYYLLTGGLYDEMGMIIEKVRKEFIRFFKLDFQWKFSKVANIMEIESLYHELNQVSREWWEWKFEYDRIRRAGSMEQQLFELSLLLIKLRLGGYGFAEQKKIGLVLAEKLSVRDSKLCQEIGMTGTIEELWAKMFSFVVCDSRWNRHDKDSQRMAQVFVGIYQNISAMKLSVQWLSKEVLFLSEDYLGRLFYRSTGKRYSDYLLETRIALAIRLIQEESELKISVLAECVGYAADGQYFAKMFKKVTGKSPSEYKECLRIEAQD